MQKSLRTLLVAVSASLGLALEAHAQWTTQSIQLRAGWNAVFIQVQPEPSACHAAFAGLPVESGEQRLASPRIDRYRRPYEGTDNARAAMQAYLDWEFGLVEQLGRDGTHFFFTV